MAVVRVAVLVHCVAFLCWVAFASAWFSGAGLSDFSEKDIAGHREPEVFTCITASGIEDETLTSKPCCEDVEGNTWEGKYVVAYRYKMRSLTIYMGMGHSTTEATLLFVLLCGAFLPVPKNAAAVPFSFPTLY